MFLSFAIRVADSCLLRVAQVGQGAVDKLTKGKPMSMAAILEVSLLPKETCLALFCSHLIHFHLARNSAAPGTRNTKSACCHANGIQGGNTVPKLMNDN